MLQSPVKFTNGALMQILLAKLSLLFPPTGTTATLLKVIKIIVPVDRDLGKKLADNGTGKTSKESFAGYLMQQIFDQETSLFRAGLLLSKFFAVYEKLLCSF
jgi:hypothetical protein